MFKNLCVKANLILIYIGIFAFLFLWDVKGEVFELRYLIILPIFTSSLFFYAENLNRIIKDLLFPTLIFLHLFIIGSYFGYDFVKRDYFGLIYLALIFLVIKNNKDIIFTNLHKILSYFVIFFTVFYIIFFLYSGSNIVLSCYNGWFFRTKFFFLENSHFAIIAVPIINYFSLYFSELENLDKKNAITLFFSIIFLLISYSNFSTTFLIGMGLSQLMILFKKNSNARFFFFSIYIIIVCLVTLFGYEQCTERSFGALKPIKEFHTFKKKQNFSELEILNKDKNEQYNEEFYEFKLKKMNISMSVETFLVSLEITKKSLTEKPFGAGFNKYYISHNDFINKILLTDPDIKKNNIMDGSTNISKLITEFGIFGLLIISLVPFFYFRNKNIKTIEFFLLSLISMQFLRGVGYFNGGFLFAYILLFYRTIYLDNLKFKLVQSWQNKK